MAWIGKNPVMIGMSILAVCIVSPLHNVTIESRCMPTAIKIEIIVIFLYIYTQ